MVKRKLEELNLLDNFLFGSMVTHPELGESFVRELLQIIFNRQFGKLIVVPQKVYNGTDTDIHGAMFSVSGTEFSTMLGLSVPIRHESLMNSCGSAW